MRKPGFVTSGLAFVLLLAGSTAAFAGEKENGKDKGLDPAGIQRLEERTGGRARVRTSAATGAVRFVGIQPGEHGDLMASSGAPAREKASAFLREYSGMFGLRDVDAELQLGREQSDKLGGRHLSYFQTYRGVPVFAGVLRAHFGPSGELRTVNGNVIPELRLDPTPTRSAAEAGAAAIAAVSVDNEGREVFAQSGLLMVYRTGLAQGVEGQNYLTWQIEVGNGSDIREFVYVDAHSGKIVDRLPGIIDAMFRRAYNGLGLPFVPTSYPGSPFWVENDPFPTAEPEANNMIIASKDTYDFYKNAFGRDSFDGAGAIMDSIFNRGYDCPNASWNGTFISFCAGFTTDDVTGHEWTHAYTQYTHGLIYQWQPGALNESYSDIFGETIDRINGKGGDTPDNARSADACTTFFGAPPPSLVITGGSAAGSYITKSSVNEPARPFTRGPTDMAVGVPASACTGPVTGVTGKIAIVDFTFINGISECASGVRATNARLGGATAIIFVAPPEGVLNIGSNTLIASVQVTNADGAKIKAGLPAQATMAFNLGTDNSVRWLVGEDDTNPGLFGALRDMWNPRCFGNPGRVGDVFEYTCSAADAGGVHTNSGVPNHAYALLVDGGVYNGQTITGIGLTKAAHIYFRAMNVYQNPTTDFAEHADAIEQSASDLVGVNLPDLVTGLPSGQVITAADVTEVEQVMLAVEMRTPPTFCNFQPLLAQNPPALCAGGGNATQLFHDTFNNASHWDLSHQGVTADFTDRDWELSSDLPDRAGKALFAVDPTFGTCAPGGDESGVLHADSKKITIPASVSNPRLTFVHWVATEPGFDGGNLKISVNGGPWQLIQPADFIYNPYNRLLVTAAAGNTNPLAGQPAFSGTDGGAVGGTWGRSIVNLAPYAKPKDKIQLRFDLGTDGCGGAFGWYIDDVMVYKCH